MDLYSVFIAVGLFALGAIMGSFIGAMTWRMRHHRDWVRGRSECEHCHHKLSPLDLIPILSWLCLLGKCRYCHKPIGWTTFLLEIGTGLAFVISFLLYPLSVGQSDFSLANAATMYDDKLIVSFALWLVQIILMVALFTYDVRWKILPNKFVFPLITVSAVNSLIAHLFIIPVSDSNLARLFIDWLLQTALAMLPIAGVYLVLYVLSKGRWIGFGDIKLGVAIGFMLPWFAGVLVLFGANLLSTLVAIPLLIRKKLKMASEIPFGPYLIIMTYWLVLLGASVTELLKKWLVWI